MGYQVTFTPTEEKMNQYKPYNEKRSESMIDNFKYELISYCMNKEEDKSTYNTLRHIKFLLECLYQTIEREEKENAYFRWKEDDKHELWYCGWEFAHDSSLDKDTLLHNTIEKLFILTDLVKTPSYFDEHEKFNTKYSDLVEDIDDFIEEATGIVIHKIINDLDEFKVNDNEPEDK